MIITFFLLVWAFQFAFQFAFQAAVPVNESVTSRTTLNHLLADFKYGINFFAKW